MTHDIHTLCNPIFFKLYRTYQKVPTLELKPALKYNSRVGFFRVTNRVRVGPLRHLWSHHLGCHSHSIHAPHAPHSFPFSLLTSYTQLPGPQPLKPESSPSKVEIVSPPQMEGSPPPSGSGMRRYAPLPGTPRPTTTPGYICVPCHPPSQTPVHIHVVSNCTSSITLRPLIHSPHPSYSRQTRHFRPSH